jgi:hypothetical protein
MVTVEEISFASALPADSHNPNRIKKQVLSQSNYVKESSTFCLDPVSMIDNRLSGRALLTVGFENQLAIQKRRTLWLKKNLPSRSRRSGM